MNSLNLKELRKKLNLTQEELAEITGISRTTVVRHELSNNIPPSKIKLYRSLLQNDTFKKNELNEEAEEYTSQTHLKNKLIHLKELLLVKNELIEALKNRVEDLLKTLKSKDNEIEALKKIISKLE